LYVFVCHKNSQNDVHILLKKKEKKKRYLNTVALLIIWKHNKTL
jgi:hypothetical protein